MAESCESHLRLSAGPQIQTSCDMEVDWVCRLSDTGRSDTGGILLREMCASHLLGQGCLLFYPQLCIRGNPGANTYANKPTNSSPLRTCHCRPVTLAPCSPDDMLELQSRCFSNPGCLRENVHTEKGNLRPIGRSLSYYSQGRVASHKEQQIHSVRSDKPDAPPQERLQASVEFLAGNGIGFPGHTHSGVPNRIRTRPSLSPCRESIVGQGLKDSD